MFSIYPEIPVMLRICLDTRTIQTSFRESVPQERILLAETNYCATEGELVSIIVGTAYSLKNVLTPYNTMCSFRCYSHTKATGFLRRHWSVLCIGVATNEFLFSGEIDFLL